MEQQQFQELSIKAIEASCGTQIAGRHFGGTYQKVKKIDPKTKKPEVREIDGKEYPVFVEKRDKETGDQIFDNDGKPVYEVEFVPDVMNNVTNADFIWAITNKKAVSNCRYNVKYNPEAKSFYIVAK